MRKRTLRVCVWIFYCPFAFSQNALDSLSFSYQDAIENTVAANADAGFDYDTEFEHLADFIRHPLSINRASATDFQGLRLLAAEQITNIIAHRGKYKNYVSLLELQPVLDLPTIHKILPFVTVENEIGDFLTPVREWFKRGKNDAFVRYERRLEPAAGFKRPYTEGGYLGDPNRVYMRYRYSFGQHLSYGFTLKKDAGEPYWDKGVDFASFHFKMSGINKTLKDIVLGDYTVALGQGLIHQNGFAIGKSALVLNVEKNSPPLRQYTSSNATNFLRGGAIHAQIAKNTEGTLFVSKRQRYANFLDTIIDNERIFSALELTGLHRTQTERNPSDAIGLFTIGSSLKRTNRTGSIGINTVFNQFDGRLEPRDEPYNFYVFRGKRLFNVSTDYKKSFQNFHVFGETAMSNNGGFGTLNGLLIGLDKRLSISFLQRYFSLKYQTLQAQPFSESTRPQDERGFFLGLEFKPNRTYTLSGYADFWQHQWWRFRVDAPSRGQEFFGKIAFRQRYTEGYLQFRIKTKQENATDRPDSAKTNIVVDKTRSQIRLQFNNRISKGLELRNRLEWSFYQDDKGLKRGFMVWQDIVFSPERALPLRGMKQLRGAIFKSPSSRISKY